MSKKVIWFFILFVILTIGIYKLFNFNKMKAEYIYVIEDNPSFIVLNSSKVKDFEEILKESKEIEKNIFIKKYLNLLKSNINRNWVLTHSKTIKRRYELIGLDSFNEEEEFYYEQYESIVKWAEKVIKLNEKIDDDEFDSFLEYILFLKSNGIEEHTWYMKPSFDYSIKFYNMLIPKSYDYLISEDFIDDDLKLSLYNLFNENIPDVRDYIKNNDLENFDYQPKKQYYLLKKGFIDETIKEMEKNFHKISLIENKEEKKIFEDDYYEFLNILKTASGGKLILLNVL